MTAEAKAILVTDPIAEKGLALLRETPGFKVNVRPGLEPDQLARTVRDHEALIVRSGTRVTAEVLKDPGRLKVIGRAGTGVDNIDLAAATRAGVVVLNTPGGNSIAAAELTVSLLLALARHIPQANRTLRAGHWDRKKYVGVEVSGKILGVIGLGRVGREVARRARGCRMEVLGFDPYVSREGMRDTGVEGVNLDELLKRADFVTLHLPLTSETRNLLDAEALGRMKPGARIVNCARGGLLDEAALLAALQSGHLAGAALDVFEQEPPGNLDLLAHPEVICTPHLGASTVEAQERVGADVATKVRDFLKSGTILDAVNFPAVSREEYAQLQPVMELGECLGRFVGQVARGGMRALDLKCYGDFNKRPLRPLVMAAVKGLLAPVLAGTVSHVNALEVAAQRGLVVEEGRSNEPTPFAGLLRLSLTTDSEQVTVAGTLFTRKHPRLVEVDGVRLECSPQGHLLFFRNRDVPGVVGRIGTILGQAGVNIAGLQLGRSTALEAAVSLVKVDGPIPGAALEALRALPELEFCRALKV